jgi:hypothetical protein
MAPASVHWFHACKQYIFFVSRDGNFIDGVVALHDPTCHTQTVIFCGARWYNYQMQDKRLHSDSSFFPSPSCTYDSFPASSHLVF